MACYAVWAVDLTDNRFTSSLNDEWRCLEDTGGMRDACGNRTDDILKTEIINCAEWYSVWNTHVFLTVIPRQMKETKHEDHEHHIKEV